MTSGPMIGRLPGSGGKVLAGGAGLRRVVGTRPRPSSHAPSLLPGTSRSGWYAGSITF